MRKHSVEALLEIACSIRDKEITTSHMVKEEDMLFVFNAMRNVTLGELVDWEKEGCYLIYEWNDRAVSQLTNGMPCFDTFSFITKDEWDVINEEILRLNEKPVKRDSRKQHKK